MHSIGCKDLIKLVYYWSVKSGCLAFFHFEKSWYSSKIFWFFTFKIFWYFPDFCRFLKKNSFFHMQKQRLILKRKLLTQNQWFTIRKSSLTKFLNFGKCDHSCRSGIMFFITEYIERHSYGNFIAFKVH